MNPVDELLAPDGPLLWMLIVAILLLCYLVWFLLARRFDLAKPEYIINASNTSDEGSVRYMDRITAVAAEHDGDPSTIYPALAAELRAILSDVIRKDVTTMPASEISQIHPRTVVAGELIEKWEIPATSNNPHDVREAVDQAIEVVNQW